MQLHYTKDDPVRMAFVMLNATLFYWCAFCYVQHPQRKNMFNNSILMLNLPDFNILYHEHCYPYNAHLHLLYKAGTVSCIFKP